MKRAEELSVAAVLGAGTMGHGIAQVLAMCDVEARLYDVDGAAVELLGAVVVLADVLQEVRVVS